MAMLLGAVADDLTGATDLCLMLSRGGMRVVQAIGVPEGAPPAADAVVVALKSRTIPADEAVAQSLAATRWLRAAGARQLLFKYCSTFDSTDDGNIGPVAEAMLDELGEGFSIACPAFPENGRSIYLGHLFVGEQLLSDSSMREHPLTPMTDANLVRVLQRQCRAGTKVGLIAYPTVEAGPDAVAARIAALRKEGVRLAIADAVSDGHLRTLGRACRDLALITGGSGIALGLPGNFRDAGQLTGKAEALMLRDDAPAAVLAGSCSAQTRRQVAAMAALHPALCLDPVALAEGRQSAAHAVDWAVPRLADGPVLIYSTAAPDAVGAAQATLGREAAASLVEAAFAAIADGLVGAGVRRLVVAGGETSGAVVGALGVGTLEIGPEIDPGVPWTLAAGPDGAPLWLALKSGNFGAEDFFAKALGMFA